MIAKRGVAGEPQTQAVANGRAPTPPPTGACAKRGVAGGARRRAVESRPEPGTGGGRQRTTGRPGQEGRAERCPSPCSPRDPARPRAASRAERCPSPRSPRDPARPRAASRAERCPSPRSPRDSARPRGWIRSSCPAQRGGSCLARPRLCARASCGTRASNSRKRHSTLRVVDSNPSTTQRAPRGWNVTRNASVRPRKNTISGAVASVPGAGRQRPSDGSCHS